MSVTLSTGGAISLEKPGGGAPAAVRVSLGWRVARPSRGFFRSAPGADEVDLDASAVLFAGREATDVVYVSKLSSDDGSVVHSGDDFADGRGRENGESIVVSLSEVPSRIDQIVFTVNSFTGQTFAQVESAFCRVVDERTGRELARFTLAGGSPDTARIMAKMSREGSGWRMTAIGVPASGETFKELLPAIITHL
ncbi:TerD family protein [Streptomyces sp. 4N509B]|uniref:TerD family protein n=1 Tax=Streptomyces sp. 4N509B TaxID=3457413 RepID=UPI003FD1E64C